ncbi:MAG TPA: DUF4142 domain-containing protein, partial [Gammaproteobacteria bacterium]|nr:DUF4142 domain-containing protein [Gammaproteobacteria bacterium]
LDENVLEYANFMIDEHTKNQQQTEEVAKEAQITAIKDKDAKKLEKKGKEGLEKMQGLDDKKFQKEYIKTMIHDHKDALKAIDKNYLPEIKNQELKAHFSETRKHVEDHLNKAKELKENLDDKKS